MKNPRASTDAHGLAGRTKKCWCVLLGIILPSGCRIKSQFHEYAGGDTPGRTVLTAYKRVIPRSFPQRP
jgi:hypothetical protein